MKYIRTKDYNLILQVSDKITDEYGTYYLCDNDTKWFENRLIKAADTIKELCDEFVVVATDREKPFIYALEEPIDSPLFDSEEETVYGAIWVFDSNGTPTLKPVAKMNAKGEFELI